MRSGLLSIRGPGQSSFARATILDGQGAGVHWSEATRRTNRKHYAGWLGWRHAEGLLDTASTPADRITPELVRAYARDLMACVAQKTLASYLRDLKVVIKAVAPNRDWHWLMDLSNRLKAWARPSRERAPSLPPLPEVFRILLDDLQRLADIGPSERAEQLAFRDDMLVGMLLAGAPRLRNLAMIRIGVHLQKPGSEWHLRFDEAKTKTRRPLHLVLPWQLNTHLEHYVDRIRIRFLHADRTDCLWMGGKGKPMAHHSIYDHVRKATDRLFGTPISPHAFRSIAATFLAETSSADALSARPLLGHANQTTTETHYIMARQLEASRKVNEVLRTATGG